MKVKFPKRAAFVMLSAVIPAFMSSCGGKTGISVVVAGSTSVQPYVEMLAEEYELLCPGIVVDIQGGGSSAGVTAVESRTADVGMSSRELNEKERELWSTVIAKDGLALIAHPDNPVDNLAIGQIRDIYSGKITNWRELNGADAKIHIISREEGSGTRSAFEDMVMAGEPVTPKAIVQNSNGAVRLLVSNDPNAVGFISLGLIGNQAGLKPVKALKLDGVSPTRENVINGGYSLYRPFLLVAESEPEGAAKLFVDFILSEEGQRLLVEEGLVSVREGTGE
ncbi:MAG: phosphate ABC transporter substrate-binding protein [Oscillospiraceae bacterium]|jgi:phosphate transport system substrate-binding protein|nr:phosphate ABC transporter substrate-binding protein [Oscillospiraceae bacterium]